MSIIDPTGADEAVTPKPNLLFTWVKKYGLYLLLVTIALLRGAAYANLMPPWAIIDEEQHVDYIQVLSDEGRRPDPRKDYLSHELVASLFDAHRWETFGFGTPSSMDPRDMRLEGHSYEGYQPPLYYLVMVPIYRMSEGGMLQKLFLLRWATVALSTLTVVFTYKMARQLTGSRSLAFLAGMLLILIPERTVAVSRVNNDVLLEVFGAGYLWLTTLTLLEGPTDRRSLLLGGLLGLGTLAKMPMALLIPALPWIFIVHRKRYSFWRGILLSLSVAAILIVPLLVINFMQFGDLTGFVAVAPLLTFSAPDFTWLSFARSILDLFLYLWVIPWQRAQAFLNPSFSVIYGVISVIVCLAIYGLVLEFREKPRHEADRRRRSAQLLLIVCVAVYDGFTLLSFWNGQIPVIQGRFLLPVIPGAVILLSLGLRRAPRSRQTSLMLLIVLVATDGFALFSHLLPQYYPPASNALGENNRILEGLLDLPALILRAGRFKPEIVQRLLRATIVGYLIAQIAALIAAFRTGSMQQMKNRALRPEEG
jgi:4-amino-4-deoxy-L-arabinose transferase-like glycosyltransferase